MAEVKVKTGDEIEIKVPCKAEYVRTVRKAIAEFAASINMPEGSVEDIEVAASEAVANVIRHAYGGSDNLPRVKVKCTRLKAGLLIEVADKGRGFDAPPANVIPEVDFDRDGGLGIILIKRLMDRVCLVSKPEAGTTIRMTKDMREAVRRLSSTKRGTSRRPVAGPPVKDGPGSADA